MASEQDKQIMDLLSAHNTKLTDWKYEPTVDALMADLRQAQPSHSNQVNKISKWLGLLNIETDKQEIKKGRSGIAPKVIRRLAEWRYSALANPFLNEKKLFNVSATAPTYINAAFQSELVLNHQFNSQFNKVKFINDLVRTAVNEGTVICRVGWTTESQLKEREIPVYNYVVPDPYEANMIMGTLQQLQQEMQENGLEYAEDTQTYQSMAPDMQESIKITMQQGTPLVAEDTGQTQIIKEDVQTVNQPDVQIIDNTQLTIDPSCEGDFSKAKFVVYTYTTSLSELKQAGIYRNLEKLDKAAWGINATATVQDINNLPDEYFDKEPKDGIQSFRFQDKARQRLKVYEYWGYWDIDGTGIVQGFVATIVNNVIIRMERNPFPDGKLPFVVIPYMPVKGSVYGEPDAELIGDNQQIITALTRGIIDTNARGANGQVAMPKGFLDIVNLKKFKSGDDYEYNPMGMHPSEAIYMHSANEIPQSNMALLQSQYMEAEASTGIRAFLGGLDTGAYGQPQAGMSQALTLLSQRESDIIFRITKGLEELGNKIISMNQEWLSEEETIAITQSEFITVKREDLQGEFVLNVTVKSNSESEGKAQQLSFVAQTLGNDVDWGVRKIMLVEMARLYNLDNLASMLMQYEPQPDPVQQQLAQLEIQMKQAMIEKEMAKAAVDRAKEQFILAQMGNISADTDLKNLEFLEQQEGVKHARQKEIVEAQAKAQNEGKIATELLKADTARRNQRDKDRAAKEIAEINAKAKGAKDSAKKTKFGTDAEGRFVDPEAVLERATTPKGLNVVDGIGTYFGTTSGSVGNRT